MFRANVLPVFKKIKKFKMEIVNTSNLSFTQTLATQKTQATCAQHSKEKLFKKRWQYQTVDFVTTFYISFKIHW